MCEMPSHKEIDRRFRRLNPHSSIGSGLTWIGAIARSTPIVRAWLAILLTAIPLVLAGPASAASPPVNTVAPTLSGTAQNGVALTVNRGTWTGVATITYAYQWQLSSDGGASWTNISGATATSYTPPAGSTGKQARALVTATNGDGTTQATSPASAPILEGLPAATVTNDGSSTPAVSGEANAQAAPADVSTPESSSLSTRTVPDTTRLVLSGLSVSPRKFLVRKTRTRVTIRFWLGDPADVTLTFARALPGRRAGRACVAPARAAKNAERCTRRAVMGSLVRKGERGNNTVQFDSRVGTTLLPPARYRLTATARDARGNFTRAPAIALFTIAALS